MDQFKALVADDDPDVSEMTAEMLRSINATVAEMPNGLLALDFVHRNDPDVIVVDLNMPLMDGVRMVEGLVREGFPPERVVILSATLDRTRVMRLAKLNIRNFFVKPVDRAPFLEKIQEVVSQSTTAEGDLVS